MMSIGFYGTYEDNYVLKSEEILSYCFVARNSSVGADQQINQQLQANSHLQSVKKI